MTLQENEQKQHDAVFEIGKDVYNFLVPVVRAAKKMGELLDLTAQRAKLIEGQSKKEEKKPAVSA